MGKASERVERQMTGPAALPRDLVPRAISAVVLAVIALGSIWAGSLPFALLVLLIGVVMSWEWARIVRGGASDAALLLHAGAVALAILLTMRGALLPAVALVAAGMIAVGMLATQQRPLSALGVAYVGLPAIALVWLRGSDEVGTLAILFIFVIVWATDIFAYIFGRLLGGPKLCPAVSPGKTWSGSIGGLVFAALAGAVFAMLLPRPAPVALALVAVALSVVAQAGDLAESALKRAFAVKNASEIIPGHGGFMDRMDGVVTAALLAAVLAAMRGTGTPAHALLFWS